MANESKKPEQRSAWQLADSITGIVGYAESMIEVMNDQVQNNEPAQAVNNIIALLDSTERYLKDIRRLCEEAQKGGAA